MPFPLVEAIRLRPMDGYTLWRFTGGSESVRDLSDVVAHDGPMIEPREANWTVLPNTPSGSALPSERIVRWTQPTLPGGLVALAEIARAEGHSFLVGFQSDWASGALRFDGPGECLFFAEAQNQLIGISGICRDPYQHRFDVGRLRHVYVAPAFRCRGVASRLVRACLDSTGSHFRVIRLRTFNPAAARLYERLAFQQVEIHGERMTHRLFTAGRQ